MRNTIFPGRAGDTLQKRLHHAVATCVAGALLFGFSPPVSAAENGSGVYLLGSRIPFAGLIPPPGVYFQNDVYYYRGDAGTSIPLPFGTQLVAGIKATTWLDLPTVLWSTPFQILGGNLAFAATFPIGGPSVDASLSILPIATISRHDSTSTIGDPFLTTQIGWHAGNFHWTTGVSVNVPVGDYQTGALANIAPHRWAADLFGGITWLDPTIGLELSTSAGFTFNDTNQATNYKTGNEFHIEWAAVQHFSKQFSAGFIGYYYQQLTGDSGAGAVLGPLEGRVLALGGTIAVNFMIDKLPITARVKVFQEVDVKSRLEGTAGYLTISMPLYVYPAAPASDKL